MTRTRIFYILITLFLISCNSGNKKNDSRIKEGIIEYKVEYLENRMSKNIPANLLPGKMILKFKNDKTLIEIEGFMGLFSLVMITDHKKEITTNLLKVIDKKYYYVSESGEESFCFREIPGMKIETKKGIKELSGYKCKRGKVSFPDTDQESFSFYYTEDINIKNSNFNNPYKNINGILMKFQVKLSKLRMELTVDKVKKEDISSEEFKLPAGFKKVSRKDMEEILNTLME